MRKNLTCLLTITLFLITSCASSQQSSSGNPQWVDNPYSVYSESEYLAAVGSGSTQNAAQDQALASLSRIFQSRIDAEQTVEEEFLEWEDGNQWMSENSYSLVNFSRISTDQNIINAEVLETRLGNDAQWYALAAINRRETSRVYSDMIMNNSQQISELERAADNSSRIYRALGLLQQARNIALENEMLSQQRNIIMGGGALSRSEDMARLNEKVRTVREQCIISISGNDDAADIMPAVRDIFQQMGFIIGNAGVLDASINFNHQVADLRRDDADFVRWTLTISVDDPELNQSLATFSHDGRDGALSYNDALKRAEFSARQHIERNFRTFLDESITNEN